MSPVDLPHGWQAKNIEDIGRVVTGSTPSTIDVENYGQSVPWVSPSDMRSNKYVTLTRNSLSKKGGALARMVPSGSVLVTCIGSTIGKSAIAGRDLCTNQQINSIIVNGDFNGEYVYYAFAFHGVPKLHRLSGTTALPIVPKGLFEKLSLPLPKSKFEQQKIAAILTAVDDKLDVIARQIDATQTLKQALMQTLFSRGLGTRGSDGAWVPHRHIHHRDGREIPRAWEAATLGAYIAELRSGVSVNAEDRVCRLGEIGVLKVSAVQDGRFVPSNHKTVVQVEVDRVAEPVQKGCIIISRANTPALVGESAYVVESHSELFLPDKLWQTRPTDNAHSTRWLAFYLQSPAVRQQVQRAATGTSGSMKNISKASLLNIFMPLVPLEEQHHIAELLGAVTSKIEALEEKHRHYQTLKRGLMQKLLTGEWRVKVDNAAHTLPVSEAV